MHRIIPPLILLFVTAFPTIVAAQAGTPSPSDAGRAQALFGADTTPPTTTPAPVAGDMDLLVIYEPPVPRGPVTRVFAQNRAPVAAKTPAVAVLSPPQTGYTTLERPPVYWFISQRTDHTIFLTLTDGKQTVYEKKLKGVNAGIQKFDLAEMPAALEKDREYEWSVTVDVDPKSPANNPFASARIMRTDLPADVAAQLRQAPARAAAILASHGIWYDTIAQINQELEARPDDKRLRAILDGLLLQVNLRETDGALVEVAQR